MDDIADVFDISELVKHDPDATFPFVTLLVRVQVLERVLDEVQMIQFIFLPVPDHQVLQLVEDRHFCSEVCRIQRSHHVVVSVREDRDEQVHRRDIHEHGVQDVDHPFEARDLVSFRVLTQDLLIVNADESRYRLPHI